MLPSMPILFTRDSQDAFGNKIEPSTSFFSPKLIEKPLITSQPVPAKVNEAPPPAPVKETKGKANAKKKDQGIDGNQIKESYIDSAFARSYYTKVQQKFSSHPTVPTNKFVQFKGILKSFDPSKETPVDLYRKIEQLFGDEQPDLVEEFLLFLDSGQAAKVGRFMDHLMLTQMTNFIELLQKSFERKPTVLRKVLRAVTTGINSGSSDEMKTRVLPHLRSNPRLTKMFKSLFPDERPPDSLYENNTDMINESFITDDKGYDVWEFEDANDKKRNLEPKEGLDTMFVHGRVFLQHGRMLRSARVAFPYSKEPYRVQARRLAPPGPHPCPRDTDERTSPKRQSKTQNTTPKVPPKKQKKQAKSPVKAAKDVNDNTNKDCVTSSPKTARKSTAKSKTCKEKKEEKIEPQKKEKKERNESRNCKKDDAKAKAVEQTKAEPSTEPKVNGSWTRDEDKTMLQVLKGEAGSEQVFCRISELLPHRSVAEIKERFCQVMNLLQQMAVAEVT